MATGTDTMATTHDEDTLFKRQVAAAERSLREDQMTRGSGDALAPPERRALETLFLCAVAGSVLLIVAALTLPAYFSNGDLFQAGLSGFIFGAIVGLPVNMWRRNRLLTRLHDIERVAPEAVRQARMNLKNHDRTVARARADREAVARKARLRRAGLTGRTDQ